MRHRQEGLEGRERQEGKAAVFYTVAFFVLTWPAITRFRTHWFTDAGDGLQNVWNIWWVERAITVLHQSPWYTTDLHYPYGTSLLAHTLNPFNGFVAIPFSTVLSPLVVYNSLVAFSFVAGGVTAYLLAHHLTRSHLPSLLAGYIFTFSSFHFAHAEGHLQLVALEWIPLFVLLWLKLVEAPTIGRGVGAALALFLVILCDYYYFMYCVIAAAIIVGWWTVRQRGSFDRQRLLSFAAFAGVALTTSGVLAGALMWSSARDPLTGVHAASEFSLDLLAPFIYGGHWRFGWLTKSYWVRLAANPHESSVHLGFAVLALALYAWLRRRSLNAPIIALFTGIGLVFLILALGPTLQIAGKAVLGNRAVLPYAWLEAVFPPLAISGVPARMMVMVTLSAAMIAAFGFSMLVNGPERRMGTAIAVTVVLAIELWPRPIPMLSIAVPKWVEVVRDLPGRDGVIDLVSDQSYALYFQTIHEKPLAFGYVSREPASVAVQDRALDAALKEQRLDRLWPDYRLRYVVSREKALADWTGARTVWEDGEVAVLDVATDERSSPRRVP